MKIIKKIKDWFNRQYALLIIHRFFRFVDKDVAKIKKEYLEIAADNKHDYWIKDEETFKSFAKTVDELESHIQFAITGFDFSDLCFLWVCDYMDSEEVRLRVTLPIQARETLLNDLKNNSKCYYEQLETDFEVIHPDVDIHQLLNSEEEEDKQEDETEEDTVLEEPNDGSESTL